MWKTELSFKTKGHDNVKQEVEGLLRALNGVVNVEIDINRRIVTVKHDYFSKDGSDFGILYL